MGQGGGGGSLEKVPLNALTSPSGLPHHQVSHHPPAAAHHVISQRGWTLWQEITIASKFRGKYLSIMPLGESLRPEQPGGVYPCDTYVVIEREEQEPKLLSGQRPQVQSS